MVVHVLKSLLISNPNLRMLTVCTPNTVVKTPDDLYKYAKKSSGLDLGFNYEALSNLTMLNVLNIHCGYQIVSPILNSLIENSVPIERLTIAKAIFDIEAFEYICKLKRLIYLTMSSIYYVNVNESHLIKWTKELPELQTLCTDKSSITIDTLKRMISYAKKLTFLQIRMIEGTKLELNDYNTMLEMVKCRPMETRLEIKTLGCENEVPADVLAKNKRWLYLSCVSWPGFTITGSTLTTDKYNNLV